jgi:putative ABC transport system permease protein
MNPLAYYLRIAFHNLQRGGQRTFVALLCIAFGVMSVVAMTLLASALDRMLLVEPEFLIGGDVTIDRQTEDVFFPEHIQELDDLQQDGMIDEYTLVAYSSSLVYRLSDSGELIFPSTGIGIDASTYPLAGSFTIEAPDTGPGQATAEVLLQQPGDVLVTRDLMEENNLKVGDTLLLSDLNLGSVVEARIQGMVTSTPNNQGSKLYYSLETARLLVGSERAENTALATAADPPALIAALEARGWRAFSALNLALADSQVRNMITLALKGTGILGLLVGGIGIANTMQVLLQRRRREVAVFKTLGYRQGQLQWMFAMEAALLGIIGSVFGAALGTGISYILVDLFSRITTLLIAWAFSPIPVLSGVLVGIITTVSFAMFAIVTTSRVPPLALLRNEALNGSRLPWFQTIGLILLCCLPFAAGATLVMGSLWSALGILAVALVGLVVLGGILGGLAWLFTGIMPVRSWPLVRMARNNLRRRGASLVFAMIALFVGVVSLALGVVTTTSAQREMNEMQIEYDGDNITVIAPAGAQAAIQQVIEQEEQSAGVPFEHEMFGYQSSVRAIEVVGSSGLSIPPVLIGRTDPSDFEILDLPWGANPEGVYVHVYSDVATGSQLEITLADGAKHTVEVVGKYQGAMQGATPRPELGVLMPTGQMLDLVQPESVQYYLKAPMGQIYEISGALGEAVPEGIVINLLAYIARFTQAYNNLFVFAVALAALALLAGILLIANSVTLAMLNRRYEIGVLKAIGYARRQVLFTLVVEYSLVALIASGTGLLGVQCFLWIVKAANNLAGSLLVISPLAAVVILASSISLALLTVLWVTWKPTQVSPVVILNDRD